MANPIASTTESQRFKLLRHSDEAITKVLDEMDRLTGLARGGGSRKRYRYRVGALRAHLGSPPMLHLVPTRWLSQTGLAFLHGCLLYDGTYCLVQPTTLHGTWNDVEGTVHCCSYLEPHIYEVEVHFAQKIDPTLYCAEATASLVLVVEDDPLTARMVAARLKTLNADVEHADNGQVAIERARDKKYDLILMDIEMPVMDGLEAVARLRADGYTGSVVAMSASAKPDDRDKCLAAGFGQFLAKPFGRDELAQLLNELREEPLFSSLQDDPAIRDFIHEFVQDLPQQTRELQQALADGDAKRMEGIMRLLKARGTSYGFEMITNAASAVESALANGASLDEVREETNRLFKLCALARAPGKSG